MLRRHIEEPLRAALADTPVVLLVGARQTGKSTLAQSLVRPEQYVTLDDATVLAAAKADPAEFVGQFEDFVVIDEVQRAPELLLPMKAAVDRRRRPGRFLLTGSADVLMAPRVAESLVGRMEHLTLWPFSQGEIGKHTEGFVDALLVQRVPSRNQLVEPRQVLDRILRGGYPAAYRRSEARRRAWFRSYVTGVLQRDVRDLANIVDLTALPRLLTLLASRAGGLLNLADVSRGVGIPYTTLQRYMALLETTFLIHLVPAWSRNLGNRVTKSPKIAFVDTALAAALLDVTASRPGAEPGLSGPMVENFVIMELVKQASWHRRGPGLFHFRTPRGAEVDVVIEVEGRLIGIEVKASGTVRESDFRGLEVLAEMTGPRFHRGIVLYMGNRVLPFGPRFHAVPVAALWEW
ncbi:MAG TPA: ATP-binding protein [Methylomirabilota bacterium]|nr:ATP-binding protein [Methylomirabilota bacterium]